MSGPEDEALAREIGKLGDRVGVAMGLVGHVGIGAEVVARFLPTERFQAEVTADGDATTILARVRDILASHGRLATNAEAGVSQYPKLSGVIGSGHFNLNPTIVHVEIIAVNGARTTLLITAAAKEGLLKQRSAEKAVRRFLGWLDITAKGRS